MPKPVIRYYGWFKTKKGQYFFDAIGHNGKIVHPSETYTTKRGMDKTIDRLNSQLAKRVPVLELPKFGKGRPSSALLRSAERLLEELYQRESRKG